ncbi:MAG: methionyl-tRNA formyltransferase [Candidatus Marinimicrobia bacterium]|nr:methionyl-tRNA formyltransferase [Candidatus Neomarinimicrobiota bacterium]
MKVIYLGTPDFAIPALQRLHQSSHEIAAVVTGLDQPAGRGRQTNSPPVKQHALKLGYPVLQPARLGEPAFLEQVAAFAVDLLVVVAFRILPKSLLDIVPKGAINLHPSLLPKYRGAAPIQRCLLNGDSMTGITTIVLTNRIDAGNILLQREEPIAPQDDFGSLSERLAHKGAQLLVESIDGLERGAIQSRPQAEASSQPPTAAPKIKPDDLLINWHTAADRIVNQVRAFSPAPGAFTRLEGQRLKIFDARIGTGSGAPGVVLDTSGGRLEIATGSGSLQVAAVQLEGRRRLAVEDFLRGRPLAVGQLLE